MRWQGQELGRADDGALPGMERLDALVRSVTTPEFAGMTFHEVLTKSALNRVPGESAMPFEWTVNPYRGCSHACVYCLDPSTRVLMLDGRQRPLSQLRVGDEILGTRREGTYRRYTPTTVRAVWRTRKRAYRVTLADGTEITASGDHRFLTERGWKYVVDSERGRPHLTHNNRLLGFGLGSAAPGDPSISSTEYRRGYLTGMIRGDGMILHKTYDDGHRVRNVHRFRLALADREALVRTRDMLAVEGVLTSERPFTVATQSRRALDVIHTAVAADVARIEALIAPPSAPVRDWHIGFLAGIFDAEGSCSRGTVRISNKNEQILGLIEHALRTIDVPFVREGPRDNGVSVIRLRGGLPARARFFDACRPATTRKLALAGAAVKTTSDLRVVGIEDLRSEREMIDITTDTGDFIAEGVVSHNCFARGTHTYLDLDTGDDFDREIVVKVNVADVLRREVRRGSWRRDPVALGTNTDPYQRAEGKYRLMPGIVAALAESGTPFSILTKGTLLRRDLPLLREAAGSVRVSLAMSIAVFDDALQHSIEPGTPTADARLATVRAAADAGFDVTVFLMPVLPGLTDSTPALDDALRRIREAGASRALFGALHLRPGTKPWFLQWLAREHPDLMPLYRRLYPGVAAYAPEDYRRDLAARTRPLLRRHRLDGGMEATHALRTRARRPAPAPRAEPARLF